MKRKNKLKKEMGYFYSMSPGDPELNAEIFNHNTNTGDIPTGTTSGPAMAEDLIDEAKKNEYEVTYIDRDTDSVTKGFVQAYSTKQAGLVFRKTHKDVYRILSIDCVEDHSKDDGEQLSLFVNLVNSGKC